ncbi:unnamed protein product [Schistosoma mattheei]|uniref:Uncharacterized protein n=1 Tax=Schistosoma mattheei TaxID=31246 RepID=A0A183NXZ7_9TREM|nr:unnamed protein product [Schistosoma mattheei]
MLPPTMFVNLRVPAKAAHLAEQEGATLDSPITKQLLYTGNHVNALQSFKVNNNLTSSSLRKFAETAAIRRQKPD